MTLTSTPSSLSSEMSAFATCVNMSIEDRLSVLLIDSNDIDRNYYADRLKQYSSEYVVHLAATGQDGLETYQVQRIDCVVLEVDLPDMRSLPSFPDRAISTALKLALSTCVGDLSPCGVGWNNRFPCSAGRNRGTPARSQNPRHSGARGSRAGE